MHSVRKSDSQRNEHGVKLRPRKRVRAESFVIPEVGEHLSLQTLNYNVQQLKTICKHYGLKRSGNKNELEKRVTTYLGDSRHANVIQRMWRRHHWRRIKRLMGPAALNRSICVNETDFFSREPIQELEWNQFISLAEPSSKTTYGFDIMSLYQLYDSGEPPLNPYTRECIKDGKTQLDSLVRALRVAGFAPELCPEEDEPQSVEKQLDQWAVTLFQSINTLGNYTDPNWFTALDRPMLIRFIRELKDIWEHRASLSIHTQRLICPPTGRVFNTGYVYTLATEDTIEVRKCALHAIHTLINSSTETEWRSLGAAYVLCALTTVSQAAQEALPWLFAAMEDGLQG